MVEHRAAGFADAHHVDERCVSSTSESIRQQRRPLRGLVRMRRKSSEDMD